MILLKKKYVNIFLGYLFILFFDCCDRPACKNSNPIFNNYSPNSEEYKNELAHQLRINKSENISYWFDRYFVENSREFMEIYVQGDSICAKGIIFIRNGSLDKLGGIKRLQLEDLIRVKGGGYQGAELDGLKFEEVRDSLTINFVFKDIESIID